MNKENLTQLVVVLAALAVAIITALWPTKADTWAPIIINYAVPLLCLLVAIFFPAGKAVASVYNARARAAYYAAVSKGAIQAPRSAPEEDVQPQIDALIQSIKNDLASDGIPYKDLEGEDDPVPIAPRLVQKLANCWNDATVSLAFKMVLLAKAIMVAGQSFSKATGLSAPTTWIEVASPQTYWANHQVNCSVNSEGLFHQVLMPLRTALKIRDTGNI
jgi:hypothetical protein